VWTTVGSTNLDNRSFALNDELNVVTYSQAVARRMEQVFFEDLERSKRIEYRGWSRRGLVDRFLEMLAAPIQEQL
jgi:cardiolipin synthase